ncbi:MAG: MltA domain-containing protein [Pseudanabaenaceae cyanobacterium SKYGB_i_bin29]|nr:MltA domain-containing protein [Pseudanabaenaceae cyanobacterium SKYG29]MDW8421392.1 MltA domain-containing protein [Pseudanabaenaceae cyanobacterium SKYGB_i_bin29]
MGKQLIQASLLYFLLGGVGFAQSVLVPVQEGKQVLQDEMLFTDRPRLIRAIDYSLAFLAKPSSHKFYPIGDITHDRMVRSLRRFRQLLLTSRNLEELQRQVLQEFVFYQSIGRDNQGTVLFTGYYEPVFNASRTKTDRFRYPLYRLPADFAEWERPHPTRRELETTDRLQGWELVWLADPLEVFLIHVQGSARLRLSDKEMMTVGYAGKTDRPYTSIGAELIKDGKMKPEEVNLPAIIAYFQRYPQELMDYLYRNESYIFFRETQGRPATGSIGVPVTAERSIATDKSLLPPGGLALIATTLPFFSSPSPTPSYRWVFRFVLDQDAGSAIRGPGRVDIFMGTGKTAQDRAGLIKSPGRLYYLLLKD